MEKYKGKKENQKTKNYKELKFWTLKQQEQNTSSKPTSL